MSALGQKPTYALQQAMSALPPIATAKAKFRKASCLLYPRKQTCAVQEAMSALGQKRTSHLFDHLVGAGEQAWWHRETERLGCFEIDYQFVLGRRVYGEV
jgi:hypothetical protein